MRYHTLLSEPTFVYDDKDMLLDPDIKGDMRGSGILGLLYDRSNPNSLKLNYRNVTDALELYIRRMLSSCACIVRLPSYGPSMWASPKQLKSQLSQSSRKRLQFIDRKHQIWKDVSQYLKTVSFDINHGKSQDDFDHSLDTISWDFYLLCLATRYHCEAPLSPNRTISSINKLAKNSKLCSESKARLSILKGLFGLFNESDEIPGFRCIATRGYSLKERIDEILEDAYLLEASHLKRCIGARANIKSIKRDLRKLVQFISKNRPWAKGILQAASYQTMLPKSPVEVTNKLLDILPDLNNIKSAPILIEPDFHLANFQSDIIVSSRRLPFREKQFWSVSVKIMINNQ